MAGAVYDVGIHLAATDGVSGVLASISKSLLGLHGSVEKLNKGFRTMHLGIAGAATAAGSIKLGHVVTDLVKANAELQRQQNLFRLAGNSADDMAKATQAAYKSAVAIPNVNVAEQFKLYRELAGATQDNAGSMAVLPDVAKAKSVIEAMTGKAGDEDMKRLFKFVELRQTAIDHETHKIDPEKFKQELQWATKALVAGQGLLTSNDFLQLVKQAGPMAKGQSAEQLFGDALAVMEDMGGARTGTSMTALGRQVFGGIMTGKVGDKWRDAGMLNQEGWHLTKAGHVQIDDAKKAVKGYDILDKEGAVAFVEKALRPAFEKMGITNRNDQNKKLYEFGSTDTARRLMSLMLAPEQIKLVQQRLKEAMGGEGFDKLFDGNDYKTSVQAFHQSMETLKTSIGDAAAVSPLLMSFAHGIAKFADFIKDHPSIGAVATIGGAGTAAVGTAVGGGLIGIAGWRLISAAGALEGAAASLKLASVPGGAAAVGGAAASTVGGAAAAVGGVSLGTIFGAFALVGGTLGLIAGTASDTVKKALTDAFGGNKLNLPDLNKKPVQGMPGDPDGRMPGKGPFIPQMPPEMAAQVEKIGAEAGKSGGQGAAKGFNEADFFGAGAKAGASLLKGLSGALDAIGGAFSKAKAGAGQGTTPAAGPGKQTSLTPPASATQPPPRPIIMTMNKRVIGQITTAEMFAAVSMSPARTCSTTGPILTRWTHDEPRRPRQEARRCIGGAAREHEQCSGEGRQDPRRRGEVGDRHLQIWVGAARGIDPGA